MVTAEKASRTRVSSDLVWIGILILLGLKHVAFLFSGSDLTLADEAGYMNGAKALFVHPPDVSWGVGYSAWLRLITVLCGGNTISAYYLSHALLLIALPIAFFVFLRSLRVGLLASGLISAWLLASNVARIWPFVAFFSIILLLFFCAAAAKVKSTNVRIAIVALGSIISSTARPELVFVALVLLAVLGWRLLRHKSDPEEQRGKVYGLAGATVVLFALFWIPYFARIHEPDSPNRLQIAFSQHYALGYNERHHLPVDHWSNHDLVTKQAFGENVSVFGALKNNPREFAAHMAHNLVTTPINIVKILAPGLSGESQKRAEGLLKSKVALGLLGLLAIAAIAFVWVRRKRSDQVSRAPVYDLWIYLVLCIPCVLSIFVLYPRYHYLLPLLLIGGAVLIGKLFAEEKEVQHGQSGRSALIAGVALLVIVPNQATGWNPLGFVRALGGSIEGVEHPVLAQALAVRDAVGSRELVLGDDSGIAAYLPLTVRGVRMTFPGLTFEQNYKIQKPDSILIDVAGVPTSDLADPSLQSFLKDPAGLGYRQKIKVPTTPYDLYLP